MANESATTPATVAFLEAVVARLGHWCGVPQGTSRVRSEARQAAVSGGDSLDILAAAARAAGLRARVISLTLSQAVHHSNPDTPIVVARKTPDGKNPWVIIVRRGLFHVRVDGLATPGEVRRMTVGELRRELGNGAGAQQCLLVEAVLPAEAAGHDAIPPEEAAAYAHSGSANSNGHGNGNGNGSGHAHAHPSPQDRVRALIRLELKDLWTLFWYAVATGLLYLAIPLAVDALVSNISFGGQQRVYIQALVVLAAVLGGFLFLYALVRALAFVVIERLQRRLFVRFTADLAGRLPKVCQSEFDQVHGPELTNRFFDIMTLQKAAAQLLLDGLDVFLSFLLGSLILAFYDWTLFWFDAGLLVLVYLVIRGLGRGGVKSSIEESRVKYMTAGWLQQVALFSGAFKSPGAELLSQEQTDHYVREYLKYRRSHFTILFRQVISLLLIEVLATTLLLLWGGYLVLAGKLSVGQLVASELILTATLAASAKFGKQLETAYDLLTAIDKIGHLVDLKMERSDGSEPVTTKPGGASVRIADLHFAYSPSRPVFKGLDMTIPAGARVALFARASTGATTLLNLLFGLREPGKGYIEIDGLDLRQWNLEALRKSVARVADDDSIFDNTVRENVRMGNEAVGVAEVVEALRAVGILHKIQALPRGVDEPIALLGRSLSGTEGRQVLLARAIARSPRLLLLDGTLDGFDAEEIDSILAYLCAPERPWTLLVVTRDPDVLRRFENQLTLPDNTWGVRKEVV